MCTLSRETLKNRVSPLFSSFASFYKSNEDFSDSIPFTDVAMDFGKGVMGAAMDYARGDVMGSESRIASYIETTLSYLLKFPHSFDSGKGSIFHFQDCFK